MPQPIDRTDPVYRDGPVVSQLSDEEVWALAGLMARLAASLVRRRAGTQSATQSPLGSRAERRVEHEGETA